MGTWDYWVAIFRDSISYQQDLKFAFEFIQHKVIQWETLKPERNSLFNGAHSATLWKLEASTRRVLISMVSLAEKPAKLKATPILNRTRTRVLHGAKTLYTSTLRIRRNTSL